MDEMSLVTIHPKRIRWMKNPWDVVSGFKHDNRLKCHRGIVSQWTFQVGLNVTVDETWVDVTSRHPLHTGSLVFQYRIESCIRACGFYIHSSERIKPKPPSSTQQWRAVYCKLGPLDFIIYIDNSAVNT